MNRYKILVGMMLLLMGLSFSSCQKESLPPVADFSFSGLLLVGEPIVFESKHVTGLTSVSWNFGDGMANKTETTVTHTFSIPGTYTVRLVVTNDAGESSSTYSTVTIQKAPTKVEIIGMKLIKADFDKEWDTNPVSGPDIGCLVGDFTNVLSFNNVSSFMGVDLEASQLPIIAPSVIGGPRISDITNNKEVRIAEYIVNQQGFILGVGVVMFSKEIRFLDYYRESTIVIKSDDGKYELELNVEFIY